MNNAKLTKIIMAVAVVLAGLFYQFTQTLMADSYVAGSTSSTLQTTLETGNTGALTTDHTMELTATSTYNALRVTHDTGSAGHVIYCENSGTGDCVYARQNAGSSAIAAIYGEASGNGVAGIYSNGSGASSYSLFA